jgi:hypothetical protein
LATLTRWPLQCSFGRRNSVQSVVLAAAAAQGGIGSGHFQHRDSGQCQVTGDPGSVGASGLHADTEQGTMVAKPGQHGPIACSSGGEGLGTEKLAIGAHHRCHMQVLVSIHSAYDLTFSLDALRHLVAPLTRCRPSAGSEPTVGRDSEGTHFVRLS